MENMLQQAVFIKVFFCFAVNSCCELFALFVTFCFYDVYIFGD